MILSIILDTLYAAFYELNELDSRFMEEIDGWEEKIHYRIRVMKDGPSLILGKSKGRLVRFKKLPEAKIEVDMMIKSIDTAFIIFTGRMSVDKAYAAHAFTVRGEIADTMRLARCVDFAEANLFPNIMTKRILKEVPEREVSIVRVYANILKGLITGKYKTSKD
jgi:hypothetical protein